MRTYRELFRAPEFTPLFAATAVQMAASTVSGLALGTLVYAATRSPLLAALAMFGPSLAQVIGAAALLSAADRLPPRAALTSLALVLGVGTAAEAVPGLPGWALVAVVVGLGAIGAPGGGVRYGLLNEIAPGPGYPLARAAITGAVGAMQVGGFALGGALVAALSPRGTLLVGAALYLAAAVVARCGLRRRPARAAGRASLGGTWRTNGLLWAVGPRRRLYLVLWLPNGLIVGCESLFVPYAPGHAGLLFAVAALGMVVGDTVAGRFVPDRWRDRLGVPLLLLLAGPYLIFAGHPPVALAVAAVLVASTGYSATLLLQQRLLALTPAELSGHALGLHSAGMLTVQGLSAALAGFVAERTSPTTALAALATASIAVTLALAPGLRRDRQPAPPAAGARLRPMWRRDAGGEPDPADSPPGRALPADVAANQLQPDVEPQPSQT